MDDLDDSSERPAESAALRPHLHRRPAGWLAIAIVLYAGIGLFTLRNVLAAGFTTHTLHSQRSGKLNRDVLRSDVEFEAWLVSRNAGTLLRNPLQIFDAEHCAPETKTLTLGIPMIAMGLLATPAILFSPDPAASYNFAMFMLWMLSGLAMFLVVREWTGVPAAGIVAGIVYAFSPLRLGSNLAYPSVWDSAWIVFALFFAQRLFARGRWRDAVGLAAACALQLAASIYPVVAAAFLTPPFVVWLLVRYGLRRVRPVQLAVVSASVLGAAALLLGPYWLAREAGSIGDRTIFYWLEWADLLPGRELFLGWGMVSLGAVGLLAPRAIVADRLGGDPRWPLLGGALLATVVAAGPHAPFGIDLHAALVSLVPGFDTTRGTERFSVALQVVFSLLAGIGAAWAIRSAAAEVLVAAGLILFATLSVLPNPYDRDAVEIAAEPTERDFHRALLELGNRGPILELPVLWGMPRLAHSPSQIMLVAYHGRRTSACFASYPRSNDELRRIEGRLPEEAAVQELVDLGFTTIIVRRSITPGKVIRNRLKRGEGKHLRRILTSDDMTAWEIGPVRKPADRTPPRREQ